MTDIGVIKKQKGYCTDQVYKTGVNYYCYCYCYYKLESDDESVAFEKRFWANFGLHA